MSSTSSINGISFSGIVSGIDTDSIISKLMTLERIPQTLLQNRSDDATARKAVYSQLATVLSELETSARALNDLADPIFEKRAATSSQTGVAGATITGASPSLGTYQLTVSRMANAAMVGSSAALYTGADAVAQAAKAVSGSGINASGQTVDPAQTLASQSAALGIPADASGTITINGQALNWDSGMSLNEILGRINSLSAGATATYDAAAQQVTVASSATGAAASLTFGETAGNLLAVLNLSAGTTTGTDAVSVNLGEPLGSADAHLDQAVTSGTFTINGVIFNVDASTDTLQSVLVRINSSNAGVTANYNPATQRVSLTQKESGSAAQIVLGAAGDTSNALYALKLSANQPPVGGAGDVYAGVDAEVSLNGGATQTFAGNQIDQLITGVTLEIHGTGTSTVQIQADVDSMAEKVADFVEKYNAVMDYINTTTRESRAESPTTAEERIQGTFAGDRTFLDAKSDLNSILSAVVAGLPGSLNQLAQVGITGSAENYGKDAKLELDTEKLKGALVQDPEAVSKIFNTAGDGILSKLGDKLDSLTDIVDGSLTVEEKALDETVTRIDERIAVMEDLLIQREASLKLMFANMETMVAQLRSDGDRITALMNSGSSS